MTDTQAILRQSFPDIQDRNTSLVFARQPRNLQQKFARLPNTGICHRDSPDTSIRHMETSDRGYYLLKGYYSDRQPMIFQP